MSPMAYAASDGNSGSVRERSVRIMRSGRRQRTDEGVHVSERVYGGEVRERNDEGEHEGQEEHDAPFLERSVNKESGQGCCDAPYSDAR
jgi:hypothetical protein